jgi:glycosyltransferase involved in cell wall biosynthesis
MLQVRGLLRSSIGFCLKLTGKGEEKVIGVFSVNADAAHLAVLHLRSGAPGVAIWLFTTADPLAETEALCERVFRGRSALALAVEGQIHLWRRSVAISAITWTGERGKWAMKLAPFFVPPFRVLILNADGGFFAGTPGNVFVHGRRALADDARLAWGRLREAHHSARDWAKLAAFRWRAQAREAIRSAGERVRWAVHPSRVRARDFLKTIGFFLAGFGRLSAATGLLALSKVFPARRLFLSIHGTAPLLMDPLTSEGESVAIFLQRGPAWDGEAVERFAEQSDARWILWQEANDSELVGEAACLYRDDARTFAVSRQSSFRGWKPILFATAPFRALQKGEASRVLAPLGSSILVDRRKLLALGVPRCGMPGTAWLILFWKAAAAGWRSYSLGQDSPVKEQAEFPVQNTAFVLRTMFDSALRRLGPRQEDLSRGNIAFAPARQRDAHPERLKVLIVSPFLPYPLAHGGAVRIFNLCRALCDRVDFSLIAMREANDVVDYAALHEVFHEVHVVDKDEHAAADEALPAQVSSSESRSLCAVIQQVSQRLLPDVLQIEFTHFARFRDSAPSVPAILVEHDLTFSLYRQLAEANPTPEAWREQERWLAFERKWLAAYEGVWTVSEDDRALAIEEGARLADKTFAIINGVDIQHFRPSQDGLREEVFYVGSFRHLPNIIGFETLYAKVMPLVWARNPQARLSVVAGPDHEGYWKRFGRTQSLRGLDARVTIHGFVEELRPLYARAAVVAVPLEVSAGTNIKVLEAMACGKAIVSTPVGCAGLDLLDEYHLAIRDDWREFADAVCELLSNAALRSGLGARSRKEAVRRFSWTAIAEGAYESYLAIAGQQQSSREELPAERERYAQSGRNIG